MRRLGLVVASVALVSAPARAEVWFQLYSAPAGAALSELRPRSLEGPFPDVVACYAVGALALDVLYEVRPERDYRGRCGDGDLLTVREMTDRAMALLPRFKVERKK